MRQMCAQMCWTCVRGCGVGTFERALCLIIKIRFCGHSADLANLRSVPILFVLIPDHVTHRHFVPILYVSRTPDPSIHIYRSAPTRNSIRFSRGFHHTINQRAVCANVRYLATFVFLGNPMCKLPKRSPTPVAKRFDVIADGSVNAHATERQRAKEYPRQRERGEAEMHSHTLN